MNTIKVRSWKSVLSCLAVFAVFYYVLANSSSPRLWNRGSSTDIQTVDKKLSVVAQPCVVKDMGRLPQEVIDGVEKFVFFIGWPRSGHSIVAGLMDAHPNMLIANQFALYRTMIEGTNKPLTKTQLFNSLYNRSVFVATVGGLIKRKGYTLHMESSCQGSFTALKVIGEKGGGDTVLMYKNKLLEFHEEHKKLLEMLQIPVKVIQVIRNPYDMIATEVLYDQLSFNWKDNASLVTEDNKFSDFNALNDGVEKTFSKALYIQKMREELNLTVLEIHNTDLIHHTRETMEKICQFLNVPCPDWYLDMCDEKVYEEVSRSRALVNWDHLRADVEMQMRSYPFFKRYTFDSD